ncbi:aminodeoxychorismate/anthranilate synthase component II [bacterium]|nr:aminodeoxychorismate/anthranilate synthase component II [bacterium]
MILVIDNYDSFTYNLVQYLGELGADLIVRRNDEITLDEVENLAPQGAVISPGPGRPEDAGISVDLIKRFAGSMAILGVCLGHQAIGYAFGGKIVSAPRLMHGKISKVHYSAQSVFSSLPNPFEATRYHSLMVEPETLPAELTVTAVADDGVTMGIEHRSCRVYGVQFHPESILTHSGKVLLSNFLEIMNREEG